MGVIRSKKRDEQEFFVKADTLSGLQQAARDGACRLIDFDEAGFTASPSVQRGWSLIGEPHRVVPLSHCRRSILGAFDFSTNTLIHEIHAMTIRRPMVIQFLEQIAQNSKQAQVTVVVLDNARIHHNLPQETLDRWLIQYRMIVFYLPAYSPD